MLLAVGMFLAVGGAARAATVLVDFSAAQSTPGGPQGGNYWNTVGDTSATGLLDAATGSDSGWDVQVKLGGNTGFGGTGIDGDGAAAPFDQSFAIIDGIYSNRATAGGTSTITLGGLASNAAYDFSTYSDRASGWADGVISTTRGTGPASVALLKDSVTDFTITSTGSGVIAFTFVEGPGESSPAANSSVLNALSMTGAAGPGDTRVPYTVDGGSTGALVTVSGGDLYKANVGSLGYGSIGSNANDNNTWGTGSTAGATGPDIVTNGSTWRLAALTKIGAILDASTSDALVTPADLNQPLAIRLTLAQEASGPNTSAGYAPLAYLYGIDTAPSGNAGWWGSAELVTKSVSSITSLTTGVWDAAAGTWTFDFLTNGLLTSDTGDLLGIAIVGNEDAVADEWLRYSEGLESFLTVQVAPEVIPEPATMLAVFAGACGLGGYVRRRRMGKVGRNTLATRKTLAVLIGVCALAFGASHVHAATISVNLRNGENDNNTVDADETAGIVSVAGTHWNNITVRNGSKGAPNLFYNTSVNVKDDQGNANAATVTSTLVNPDGWSQWSDVTPGANLAATGDAGMIQSFVNYEAAIDGGRHIEVSGLGAAYTGNSYDVYLYFEGNVSRKYGLTVTPTVGSPATVFGNDAGDNSDTNNDGTIEWKQAAGTSFATANSANYARFTGLTAPGFSIDMTSDTGRATLNGFQIVESASGPATAIGVNFTGQTNNHYTRLNAADVAGVAPAANWNNINISSSRSFPAVALTDDTGAATAVTVASTVSAGYASNAGIGNSTPDHTLMNGVMNFSNLPPGGDQGTITVSNVNSFADLYDVYLYIEAGTNNNRDIELTVDGLTVRGQDRGGFDGVFTLADGTLDGTTDHDYILFSALTADSFTIDATNPLDNGRAGISGFQIVAREEEVIPEPASAVLVFVGLGAVGTYGRRRHDKV